LKIRQAAIPFPERINNATLMQAASRTYIPNNTLTNIILSTNSSVEVVVATLCYRAAATTMVKPKLFVDTVQSVDNEPHSALGYYCLYQTHFEFNCIKALAGKCLGMGFLKLRLDSC
jgi:hypothetical protein